MLCSLRKHTTLHTRAYTHTDNGAGARSRARTRPPLPPGAPAQPHTPDPGGGGLSGPVAGAVGPGAVVGDRWKAGGGGGDAGAGGDGRGESCVCCNWMWVWVVRGITRTPLFRPFTRPSIDSRLTPSVMTHTHLCRPACTPSSCRGKRSSTTAYAAASTAASPTCGGSGSTPGSTTPRGFTRG